MTAPVRWRFLAIAICLLLPVTAAAADDKESPADTSTPSPVEQDTSEPIVVDIAADGDEIPPLTEAEQALLEDFDQKRQIWSATLLEMKTIEVRYNNSVDRSPASMEKFYQLRDRARGELQTAYDAAVRFFEQRSDDFMTASFIATTLDYRGRRSYYDGCFEGAKLLLDKNVQFPKLHQLAARAALVDGYFDQVMPIYEQFLETNDVKDLENVDQMVANLIGVYEPWWQEEQLQRERDAQQDDLPRVLLETTAGPVVLELFEDQAPNTVANFIRLVEQGYYDESEFYQVIDNLLAQGGDPSGDGSGTSGQYIADEHDRPDRRRVFRGSLLMAKRGADAEARQLIPDSASSQFVITLMPLGGNSDSQTVFGRVLQGMDVVGAFRRIDPSEKKENQVVLPPDRILTAKVLRKRNHDYPVVYTR